MKKAVSVTIQEDNLLWLKARAATSSRGSLSEVLDRLVTEAREGGRLDTAGIRSVVGTVDLPADDPDLDAADSYVRGLFQRSTARPVLVRERPAVTRRRKVR